MFLDISVLHNVTSVQPWFRKYPLHSLHIESLLTSPDNLPERDARLLLVMKGSIFTTHFFCFCLFWFFKTGLLSSYGASPGIRSVD